MNVHIKSRVLKRTVKKLIMPSLWLGINEHWGCQLWKVECRILLGISRQGWRWLRLWRWHLRLWLMLDLGLRLRCRQWSSNGRCLCCVWCLSATFLPDRKCHCSYENSCSEHGRWQWKWPMVSGEQLLDCV